jgi:hypothetical protein
MEDEEGNIPANPDVYFWTTVNLLPDPNARRSRADHDLMQQNKGEMCVHGPRHTHPLGLHPPRKRTSSSGHCSNSTRQARN